MLVRRSAERDSIAAQRAMQERRLKPPDQIIACPRCQSLNTKFCYYNNYSLTQPRHFCKNCRRYWTAGGTLRNVPVGGGCRKNKRAKQRSSDLSSVLTSVESSVSALRSDDGAGTAMHAGFNPGTASSSAGYYDQHYEMEAAKAALVARQQSIRAGPSGVSLSSDGSGISHNGHVSAFSVTHGSQGSGMSHASQSAYDSAGISLGYFPVKADATSLSNGDLTAMFETPHSFRAASAAAATGTIGDGAHYYPVDLEPMNNMESNVHWRTNSASHKTHHVWDDVESRETRSVLHMDDKSLLESMSLRQAKGKSAMLSPSSGADTETEVSRPLTIWQQGPESLQPFEAVHESPWYCYEAQMAVAPVSHIGTPLI